MQSPLILIVLQVQPVHSLRVGGEDSLLCPWLAAFTAVTGIQYVYQRGKFGGEVGGGKLHNNITKPRKNLLSLVLHKSTPRVVSNYYQ